MMKRTQKAEKISVLVVDDSLVFRRFLRDIFENIERIEIVGEAKNGIEALDLVLKVKPDVILMDLEMPMMDGMTALQHLMIHCPTPTIMFSSLTNEGTARCFDTLKNGAIDFICKDFMFEEKNLEIYKNTVIQKVIGVAGNRVQSIEAFVSLQSAQSPSRATHEQLVIFCEECGTRQIIEREKSLIRQEILCHNCGDAVEVNQRDKFRRNSFLTVLAGGRGCFRNLLNIIPKFDADMGGAMVVVIFDDIAHVNSFAEYLNSICQMKVLRARENMCIDGGNCYIVSSRDLFCLKPFSANYSFQRMLGTGADADSLDLLLTSVAGIFKNRTAGVILSGDDIAGVKGMQSVVKAQGAALVLDPADCLYKEMGQVIREKCPLNKLVSEEELVEQIQALHYHAKRTVSTA
jgi:two-component system chemotaxis response regulator CheB